MDRNSTENVADPRSIVVLTREHIGDLICTTPALQSLRRRYPNAHIAVEVGERAICVLENNPNVDEIIARRNHQGLSGKWQFLRLLRRRKFELGVVLDDCADMVLYLWLGGVPRRVGLTRKKRFARLFTEGIPYDFAAHEMVDNFRNVVAQLGGDIRDARPEVFPTPDDAQTAQKLLVEAGVRPNQTLVALNPGASMPANRWLPERFAALADRLAGRHNTKIILLGGPDDLTLSRAILDEMQTAPIVLTGQLTVMQLAEVLKRCSVLVTGDTGPMHLSVAVGTPVVALFGPADPQESGPGYAPGNIVIRKVEGCPGCTKTVCNADRACMRAITSDEAARSVETLLSPALSDTLAAK